MSMLSVCGEVFTRDVGSTMANMAMIMPTIIGNRYGQIFSHIIVERNWKLIFWLGKMIVSSRGKSILIPTSIVFTVICMTVAVCAAPINIGYLLIYGEERKDNIHYLHHPARSRPPVFHISILMVFVTKRLVSLSLTNIQHHTQIFWLLFYN